MITVRRMAIFCAWLGASALAGGCSMATSTDQVTVGACAGDANCPLGQECIGGGCVSTRPTLFSHIQLASALFRGYNDESEKNWRATHADLLIGSTIVESADLRAANPNTRLFTYFTNRYHRLADQAADWCATNGSDPEDFYLHYREDVYAPGYAVVLVPGYPVGFVPGWNPNLQPDDPPASAASRRESRVPGAYDASHEPWYLANFANQNYREFAKDYIRTLVGGSAWGPGSDPEPLDGVVMDHGVYYPRWNEGMLEKTDEFYGIPLNDDHVYGLAFETFYPELEQFLGSIFRKGIDVMPNYGHVWFLSQPDRFSRNVQGYVDWVWGEVWITHLAGSTPTSGSARVVTYERDYETGIATVARQSRAGERRIVGGRDLTSGSTGTDRGRLFTLGLYYLISNPNTFFVFETVTTHRNTAPLSSWQWNPAVQYDIGQPAAVPQGFVDFEGRSGSTEHFLFEEGPDPYNPLLTYRVLARQFTKGLVLVKMLSDGSVVDDRSLTTHDAGRTYGVLNGDGTVTSYTQQVAIRNNEAVILVDP